MVARSSLLRRPTPGARPARRTSSVVAALPALAPRLVRFARHGYSDRLLARVALAPFFPTMCRPRRAAAEAPGMREQTLGVIGGSGLYELPGMEVLERVRRSTPF